MAAPASRSGGVLVQYVVVRSDLLTELSWPFGAVIAQACHACTAALHFFGNDPNTIAYTENLDGMHKVVLAAPTDSKLLALSQALQAASIDHKLWTEQPENIPTCLATKPYAKADVQSFFKDFKLFK
ncbi:putative peptidyl-tRNA hydrolase PTRHD1 [Dermacentor silvarum]|uniref:putative peptidyl-tRNA hydrolase PTRHD1 n=1 Tax=Dermacentor silvarum TaxID=543639 RepID=UPI00189A7CA3|nr:putative peptidyl-tRNA hydrolase PTRHD1 [Dermacentor silvarum]